MAENVFQNIFIPELGYPIKGKVRDIYDEDEKLMMITSDRISVFDQVLIDPINDKGRVLNGISLWWFDKMQDIIANHVLSSPDPNVLIVKKCRALPVEVIVRGYLVGSIWRDYAKGSRNKCGVILPDGMKENDPFQKPIITPTTKSSNGHDEDITPEELIQQGIISKEMWDEIESIALKLYKRGSELLSEKGIILVDTKYEFGLDTQGDLVLIDEVHTPDSSRYWYQKDKEQNELRYPDKEFVRQWVKSQNISLDKPFPKIPEPIKLKISEQYREIYLKITGKTLPEECNPVTLRLLANLKKSKIISGSSVLIIAGSESDKGHFSKIEQALKDMGIHSSTVVASAHKHPQKVQDLIHQYNQSVEPVVCITVAGRSNALSGVVAASLKWPVIACPPFKDHSDYLTNIHSSLQMPSQVPVMTVIDPVNASLSARKILNSMEMTT